MTTYIYCRTSKKNSSSLESQRNRCITYCKDNNIPVGKIYVHTGTARNGCNAESLSSIIDELNKGDTIIVPNICRFSRNVLEGLKLLHKMADKGINIYAVDENLSYNNVYDKFYFTLELASAERESNMISHRLALSKTNKRKNTELSTTDKQLITEIKRRRQAGENRKDICDDLNNRRDLYKGRDWVPDRITMVTKLDLNS